MKKLIFSLIVCLFILSLVNAVEEYRDFQIDQNILKVLNIIGESNQKALKIKNTGTANLDFLIDVNGLKNFISTKERFGLKVAEEEDIILNFTSNQTGVFTGNIIVKTDSISKIVPIVLEVESQNPVFDADIDIPAKFREVMPKQGVVAQITILNIKGDETVDVLVNYLVKDMENNFVFQDSEFIKVKDKFSYLKEIKSPAYLKTGDYVLAIEIRHGGLTGLSSSLFRVVNKETASLGTTAAPPPRYPIFLIGIAVVVVAFVLFIYRRLTNDMTKDLIERIKPKSKGELEKERLKKKIVLLKRSYKLRYIPKKEYINELKDNEIRLENLNKKKE